MTAGIARATVEAPRTLSLSQGQFSIWLAQMLNPADPCYNIGEYVEIAGTLDPRRFELALRHVVAATDALHLRFVETEAGPVQYFDFDPGWRLPIIDFAATGDAEQAAQSWMRQDMSQPMRLADDRLYRFALLRLAADRHYWYAVNHHIINDGAGWRLLLRRLGDAYTALTAGRPLPPLPQGSWCELVADEDAYRQSEHYQRDRVFWLEQLGDPPAVVSLSSKPPVTPAGFIKATRHIPHALDVDDLARRHGASPAALIISATAIYLHRMTGTTQMIIGTPVAARLGARARSIVGMAANALPLRVSIDAKDTVAEVIARTARCMRAAMRHQRYRIEDMRRDLGLKPGDRDICSTFVNFTPFEEDITFAGLGIASHPLGNWRIDDLQVVYYGGSDPAGQRIDIVANPGRYSQADVNRHCNRFLHIIEQLAAVRSDARVSSLTMLTDCERHAILDSWNATAQPLAPATVPELFEDQVRRRPDAAALVSDGRGVTYSELNAQANRLARSLCCRGLGPADRVAVAVPRSIDMAVAILAVLKAGAAYVPVDPDYPAARISRMLEDCEPAVAIATAANLHLLPPRLPRMILDDPATMGELELHGDADLSNRERKRRLAADDPAYLVYTSGSTGEPKGAVGLHGGLANRLAWMAATFAFDDTGPTLAKTSVSFIDATTEILGPLTAGGTVVLADPQAARSPADLARLIERHAIGRITVVPSLLSAILDAADAAQLAPCKLWITSGAPLTQQLWERFHSAVPHARLLNLYGMSEASGDSLYAECTRGNVSVGRPIWNTRVYILDEALEPVPIGVAGAIHIAGAGLAAGYWGRPDLTAEHFIADPHGPPGSRMYRTGDLGRWTADGTVEFLGRSDEQVKLNGIRVEPAEVEAALLAFPPVVDAAVILHEENRRLIAFIVCSELASTGSDELRTHLARLLPEPFIPGTFLIVSELPRLPNGKLDRRALRERAMTTVVGDKAVAAPLRTPTEVTLGEIWAEVLRSPTIGRHDDFFARGGDSLLATQVMTRVRRLFSLELPLSAIFEARTLDGLARRIDAEANQGRSESPAPAIIPSDGDGPAPLSFSQQRMWIIQSLDPQNTAYNMCCALRLRGRLDVHALSRALDILQRRHEILHTTYDISDGRVVQQVQPCASLDMRPLDLAGEHSDPEAMALQIANAAAATPFDLADGPVFTCRLMRLGPDQHVLQMSMHHIAGDQWSAGVIGRELVSVYNAIRAGRSIELATPRIRYRDFARWQRPWLESAGIAAQLAYWRRTLSSLPPLNLPLDRPRPRVQTLNGGYVQSDLPPELLAALEQFGRRESATLFMTMFAGFVALLHRLSAQDDFAVGVPVANRTHDAVEQVVGSFVNILPLRVDLAGDPTFVELVGRVRTMALDAFAHQDVPFDKLVQELLKARDTSRAPLAQVLFNMLNTPMHGIDIDGLTWEPLLLDRGGAQFELSLSVDSRITKSLTVEYNTDLFDRSTIERFIDRYLHLLSQAVSAPVKRLSELDSLPQAERRLVLKTWNETSVPEPTQTFIAMFESRAAERPGAPAVTFEGTTWSYGELNGRANALARELILAGVGTGTRVGVCLERSPVMLSALLAVQKSGGAYVPLDPGLPAQRLAYMIADSGIRVLIASGSAARELDIPPAVISLDPQMLAAAAAAGAPDPRCAIAAADPAYVIYTSGSSGRPKGVAVSHGSLANFLCSMQREPGLTDKDVLAAVTTISFDIAGLELYLPLLAGARIELAGASTASDGRALSQLLVASAATVMQATPATWRMLVDAGWTGSPALRALCGGEGLPLDLADALLERVGELWNLYGPTETTVWSTAGRVQPGDKPVSIGRPIANTQVYILNGRSPAPVGVAGEICIGGAGVAIGYHGQPGMTAERFVADPFSDRPNARLYRTGDLGYWGADGRLYHMGRMDFQVKVRGFRVETEEVEAVLNEHPAVRQAVVLAREMGPGDLRLVAYVMYAEGSELTISELRRFLRQRLPEYMIPSLAVALERIPLTPNGKLDRNGLPDPFAHASRPSHAFETPAPGAEAFIAGLWSQLLKVERIGAEDNFFELGGHSLLALQFVARLERCTGRRIDPRSLFFQTLRQIAASFPELADAAEAGAV